MTESIGATRDLPCLLDLSGIPFIPPPSSADMPYDQQFTYGVVSEGLFAESLRKFCAKFAEILLKIRLIASAKGAEILRKVCGNSQKFAESFLQ